MEVDYTQSWATVVVNGETLYDGAKNAHPVTHKMPCYSSFPNYDAADVTITALSMSSDSTLFRMFHHSFCDTVLCCLAFAHSVFSLESYFEM